MILFNVNQKCGSLPLGSAVNLNKLNLIEIELFIKMLYGVWSSLQPDHETNKSPRRMHVSPPARNDDRSPTRGGDFLMKKTGMLVVSLRGVNFGFWSRLGCSGQSANILSRQCLV